MPSLGPTIFHTVTTLSPFYTYRITVFLSFYSIRASYRVSPKTRQHAYSYECHTKRQYFIRLRSLSRKVFFCYIFQFVADVVCVRSFSSSFLGPHQISFPPVFLPFAIIKMAHRKSSLFQMWILMLCVLSKVNGLVVIKNIQAPSVGRRGNEPICSSTSLKPALKCGCFLYYPFYSSMQRWKFIEDLCRDSLPAGIESGEIQCHLSLYGNSVGTSIPRRLLHQLSNRAADFFRNASRQCSPTEIPTSEPRGSTSLGIAESPFRRRRHFNDFVLFVEGYLREERLVAKDDVFSGFTNNEMTRGAFEHSFQKFKEPSQILSKQRNIEEAARSKLTQFCFTYTFFLFPEGSNQDLFFCTFDNNEIET